MRTCFFIAHVKKGKKCQGEERKGQKDVYVVPFLNLGKLINAYVERAGVALAHPDENIIKEVKRDIAKINTVLTERKIAEAKK